jgi:predicted molibdopterin-dependent oxidoreductase YjgC
MSLGLGRVNQVTKVRTTCSYCGVGCTLDLNVRDGRIVRVTSSEDAPVNGLSLCVKGRYGYDYVHHPDRLTRPMVRAKWLTNVESRVETGEWKAADPDSLVSEGEAFIETDWDTALDMVAGKFTEAKKTDGSDALAVLASAKCTNEENYLFNKFARQVLGTNTIDHCARL